MSQNSPSVLTSYRTGELASPSPANGSAASSRKLAARLEPFDSYWQAPADVERGYKSFGAYYRANYLPHVPPSRDARILVISCGPGYLVDLLVRSGYRTVVAFPRRGEGERAAYNLGRLKAGWLSDNGDAAITHAQPLEPSLRFAAASLREGFVAPQLKQIGRAHV